MKIGIDVHSIGRGSGGNETYYKCLLEGLLRTNAQHRYVLYSTNVGSLRSAGFPHPNFLIRDIKPGDPYSRIIFSFAVQLRREPVDVFHAQFIVPSFLKCRTVTTIPDIAYEHFPEFFPPYQKAWSKVLIRRSARRADHIITVSQYSKNDLVNTYDIPPEKITVTYEAIGNEFYPRDNSQARDRIASRYGIGSPFVLYLGRLQGRKNLVRLVEAYSIVRQAGCPHKLVLAGGKDSMFMPVVERIRELRLEEDVVFPGYIPSQEVPWFYNAASAFIYPSLFEGFGLPVVEAMACGTPVVTARGSALEEIAAGAALIVDPLDVTSIAGGLQKVLEDQDLRSRLINAGLKRSASFSCEETARQTVAVYEKVLGTELVPELLGDWTPNRAYSNSKRL